EELLVRVQEEGDGHVDATQEQEDDLDRLEAAGGLAQRADPEKERHRDPRAQQEGEGEQPPIGGSACREELTAFRHAPRYFLSGVITRPSIRLVTAMGPPV